MRNDPQSWNARYAGTDSVWSAEPNALAAELVADLPPGRALDLAAGEGRMALWLAARGWTVTALDFSAVGLAKGRTRAEQDGLDVRWQVADATTADLGVGTFDLVLVLYLHLPGPDLLGVLTAAAHAVADGGHLLVLGHDRDNLTSGTSGPQDPDVLYDPALLARAAAAGGLTVLRAEQVQREVSAGTALDAALLARAERRPGLRTPGQVPR